MGGRGGLEGVGAWAGGSFSCVQNMPCEQYVYIYIYIYVYICNIQSLTAGRPTPGC
jgi:hypothetical protein